MWFKVLPHDAIESTPRGKPGAFLGHCSHIRIYRAIEKISANAEEFRQFFWRPLFHHGTENGTQPLPGGAQVCFEIVATSTLKPTRRFTLGGRQQDQGRE